MNLEADTGMLLGLGITWVGIASTIAAIIIDARKNR